MGKASYEIGKAGEASAEEYLRNHGYQIIEKNFHSRQGEIDIIARDRQFLVFVEVKNYSYRSYGLPVGAVTKGKKQSIIHAACLYLYSKKIENTFCRFDVLTVYQDGDGEKTIELFKDAFRLC